MYKVNRNSEKQWLTIGSELEGQIYSQPDAKAFGCTINGPGAISASVYTYSFILPAWLSSNGHGLILGLGAGAGITMLLSLFPDLKLTVIEHSIEVRNLVSAQFPLIAHYVSLGRLNIIIEDAVKFCNHNHQTFDFTVVDIYKGDGDIQINLNCYLAAQRFSKHVLANLMTTFSTEQRNEFAIKYDHSILFPATADYPGNWILMNILTLPTELGDFKLFKGFDEKLTSVTNANNFFSTLLKQIPASCFYSEL